jgi:UDP-N-acetylmuramoylalanine--D-glutamate ligase
LRGVVAIGESAAEIEAAFEGATPTRVATTMKDAVRFAAEMSKPGDVVLLSPACASFDWYQSYEERGDAFVSEVEAFIAGDGH